MSRESYITIGKVLSPSGLNGHVKIKNYSGIPGRFAGLNSMYLKTKFGLQGVTVEEYQEYHKGPVIKFKNIDSRTAAESIEGCEILIDFTQRVSLPEDTFFIHDLIGMKVYNNGEFIGEITEVMTGAGNDIYVVSDDQHREILIPAVSNFVKNIDQEQNRMDVTLIEGMIPEDEN